MTVPTQQNSAMEQLIQQLGGCVETALEPREGASYDRLKVSSLPDAVIRVQKDTQVGEVLKIANEFTIPVTTRGAGSSLTGGATPIKGGWVLDLSGLNHLQIDEANQVAHCGPGVVVAHLQAEAAKDHLFY